MSDLNAGDSQPLSPPSTNAQPVSTPRERSPILNTIEITDESLKDLGKENQQNSSLPSETSASNVSSTAVSGNALRKRSKYWDYFEQVVGDDYMYKCIYCGSLIRATTKNGTSGLKNHIDRCKRFPANSDKKPRLIDFNVDKDGNVKIVDAPRVWEFSQVEARRGLAIMIILDELPFSFVEHEGFHEFCKRMNPIFKIPSRRTITRDCYGLFIHERLKLKRFFSDFSSRVSLTTDTWTSGQNLSYMCLTAHYIDDKWILHKKIINLCHIAGHSGEFIGKAVEKCLIHWGIKNIMTVTVDNASVNDLAIKCLRRRLNHTGGSVLNGKYLHMRCAAHILNLIVKDGLKELSQSITKIRIAVKYVRSSPARLQKFESCVEEERIECKGLVCLDVDTRWNSTYLMLDCAVKFRLAFENLRSKDGPYVKEFEKIGGPPSMEDWNIVNSFLPFLKIFYDATLRLSGSKYVTGNYFVPQLFEVGDMISSQLENPDQGMQRMASRMKLKMDKYWINVENVNILPFVAFVLDPRYKLHYLELVLEELYDAEKVVVMKSKVQVTMRELFHVYNVSVSPPKYLTQLVDSPTFNLGDNSQSSQSFDSSQRSKMKFERKTGRKSIPEKKNELDKYLDDDAEPIGEGDMFDILLWWKDHQKIYPVLSLICRDVLAIPSSTVASEASFSTGGRVLDEFRSSLTPRMVEALVCGQDWMRMSREYISKEECLLDLEILEQGMQDLILQQPLVNFDETSSLVD